MLTNLMIPLTIRAIAQKPEERLGVTRTYKYVVERGAPDTRQSFLVIYMLTYVRTSSSASWIGAMNISLLEPHEDVVRLLQEEGDVLFEVPASVESMTSSLDSRHNWRKALLRRTRERFFCGPTQPAPLFHVIEALLHYYESHGEYPLPLPPSKKPSSPWCRS